MPLNYSDPKLRDAVVVRIYGGLGNQLFMYACGLAVAERSQLPLAIHFDAGSNKQPRPFGLHSFQIQATIADEGLVAHLRGFSDTRLSQEWYHLLRSLGRRDRKTYIRESGVHFQPSIVEHRGPCYLKGHWICPRYFSDKAEEIRRNFRFCHEPQGRNKELADLFSSGPWASLHVRRGDYLTPENQSIYACLDERYYRQAITEMQRRVKNVRFAVFSDDPQWVRSSLSLPSDSILVDNNQNAGQEDLRLMSLCQHHIIANSTFSWWGAWLQERADSHIIAPATWYTHPDYAKADIVPETWCRIPIDS